MAVQTVGLHFFEKRSPKMIYLRVRSFRNCKFLKDLVLRKAVARIHNRADPLLEDRDWLHGYKLGDSSALTRLYSEYVNDVVEFLRRGFSFDAGPSRLHFRGFKEPWHLENAVQDVFIKAFSESARMSFDGIRPYRNFLFRIAKNTVIDDFRQKKSDALNVEEISSVDDQEVPLFDETLNPEQHIQDRQLRIRVEAFIGELDRDSRLLFDVRFIQGNSVEESARNLGWSEYKVKRDEKRIKKQFFHRLKDEGYFEGYRFENESVRSLISIVLTATFGMGI
jgi:RNA polymerase sigma-70 factor (ECF subfamily)